MSVANNGGKMSGMQKKHCTFVSLITSRHLTELSITCFSKAGVPDKHIIKSLYLRQKATVRYENETSEDISIKRGVRQGCILSPCLFNI